jgi:hypothetical protein
MVCRVRRFAAAVDMSGQLSTFSADELIQLVHQNRDTPYPAELDADALSDALRGILATLLAGDAGKAAAGLAVLVDTVENFGNILTSPQSGATK